MREVKPGAAERLARSYCAFRDLYENFWPATEASNIAPPFMIVKTAIPL